MKRSPYFKDIKIFAEWYRITNKIPMHLESMLEDPFLSRLKILMEKENSDRFSRRSKIGKEKVKKSISSGKHNKYKLRAAAHTSYEAMFLLIGEIFTNQDISELLESNNIDGHNALQYKKYWIATGKIKKTYTSKYGHSFDVDIYQKTDINGNCCKIKLKNYMDSSKRQSYKTIKSIEAMELIIKDLPETFIFKEVAEIMVKHKKGPMYIKDIINKFPNRFELIGEVASKKPKSGRGGNRKQVLYKKLF
jgi:hypothetical protein